MLIGITALAAFLIGYFAFPSSSAGAPTPTPIATLIASATPTPGQTASATPNAQVQLVAIRALSNGYYDKQEITVKAGIPVKLDFSAEPQAGCGRQFILDGFNVQLISKTGETESATFTPTAPGDYAYHCGMNMWRGVMHVVS